MDRCSNVCVVCSSRSEISAVVSCLWDKGWLRVDTLGESLHLPGDDERYKFVVIWPREGDTQPKITTVSWSVTSWIMMATFVTLTCPGCLTGGRTPNGPSARLYTAPNWVGPVLYCDSLRARRRDPFPRAGRTTWNSAKTAESLFHMNMLLVWSVRSLVEIGRRGLASSRKRGTDDMWT